ncbi:chemotaxis protein CheA [Pararhodospirillum photometricum]|uniref:Chemotaxis protein CheA n=1 Tax=Pararhodospirillum photometricum DSM 122 TaxID=1150469 RepID=H6SP15_PARPM|nr:chemotaxis protein CheA [Pararhodospirillum photometricum]CCG07087.1 CheA Signal Transduction Histidine Kinases (STHK) [Pararhodospirillum photometricum DSM 122]
MNAGPSSHAEVYLAEAEDLLADMETGLLDLETNPDAPDQINRVFRALHTIKGSGAVFGFTQVADFTHHVETAFQRARDGEIPVSPGLLEVTLAALDHIRDLLAGQENKERERDLLARLATHVPQTKKDKGPSASPPPPPSDEGPRHWRIRLKLAPQVMAFGTNCLRLLDELRALGETVVVALPEAIPPLEHLDPVACYMEWDIVLTTNEPRSALDDVFLFVADDATISIEPLVVEAGPKRLGEILVARGDVDKEHLEAALVQQRPVGELLIQAGQVSPEKVVSALVEQAKGREDTRAAAQADSGHGSLRVQAERLDSLMDQVGELVIAQARLRQLVARSEDLNLRAVAEEIERLSSDLRETTMSIRMVPIGTLFGRFRRVVRDVSRSLGKMVELTMDGEESELDKTVIERLNDPLVHLVRNCIDHGLEAADERRRVGKPEVGSIHLSAVHSGAQVLISITDDGRGMNRAAIRAKAEERGLLAPDTQISDSDLLAFVFHPGFSTAREVSAVSGRGVGMDVVKRTIDALRGTIEVRSTPGQGTVILLKLPLTLAIIDGLLVRVGRGLYVLPLSTVEECVELSVDAHDNDGGCDFLNIRGALVPFLRLRERFRVGTPPDPYPKVVVVSSGTARIGLVVDQVVGQHQTVIKSLGKLLADVREFSGATILGDGTVALIMDVPRLIEMGQGVGEDRRLALGETR